jgi:hypothetical protein
MTSLDATLEALIDRIGAESAVIVVDDPGLDADGDPAGRRVIASAGLPEVAIAGLTAAMRDPEHPVSASSTTQSPASMCGRRGPVGRRCAATSRSRMATAPVTESSPSSRSPTIDRSGMRRERTC